MDCTYLPGLPTTKCLFTCLRNIDLYIITLVYCRL
jgi:hypothetical protein